MKTNSDYCISSLTNSFAYDVVVNVFDVAAIRAELILLTSFSFCWLVTVLIFLDLVGQLSIVLRVVVSMIALMTSPV